MSYASDVSADITSGGATSRRAPDADRRRRLAIAVIAISAVYTVGYVWVWLPQFTGNNDFAVFWTAARWVAQHGFDPGIYDAQAFHGFQVAALGRDDGYHPFPYPPTYLAIVAPLALLPQGWAMGGFIAVTFAILLALVARRNRARALGLAASPAALTNGVTGQVAFLTTGLLAGGLRLVETRPYWAGALLGLLSFKPQLGLIVPVVLVAARAWRAFAAAALVTVALTLPSLILGGWQIWQGWLGFLSWFVDVTAHNLATNVMLMASPTGAMVAAGVPLHLAKLAQIPITLAVCFVMYRACRRDGLSETMVAAACVASLLATPFAYYYDLMLAAFAAVVLAEAGLRTGFRAWEGLAVLLAWVLPLFAANGISPPGAVPLSLALLLVVLLRRSRSETGTETR